MTRLSVSVVLSATDATTGRDIKAFARHAEQAGLDGIFVGDHLGTTWPGVGDQVSRHPAR